MPDHTLTPTPEHIGAVVPLKDYFESRLWAIKEQTEFARVSMEKRLDAMNEFRGTLKDQNGLMISRIESDSKLEAVKTEAKNRFEAFRTEQNARLDRLDDTIKDLENYKSTQEGKASQLSVNIATILSITGILIGAISLFYHK